MQTILVPLDGSAMAERILPYVRLLAPLLNAQVRLFQVIAPREVRYDNGLISTLLISYGIQPKVEEEELQRQRAHDAMILQAEGYLDLMAQPLRKAGIKVEVEVALGSVGKLVVEAAQQPDVSLVAMVTHGYGDLAHWPLGSITDKVVHATTTPVLVLRGDNDAPQTDDPSIERILVPLDGSKLAKQALPLATELAERLHANIELLEVITPLLELPHARRASQYVQPSDQALDELHDLAIQELAVIAETLEKHDIQATPNVEIGHAAETIVDEAQRKHIDLIVMATHGYGGLRRWALGSVAHKVLQAATVPLLLVRAKPHEVVTNRGIIAVQEHVN